MLMDITIPTVLQNACLLPLVYEIISKLSKRGHIGNSVVRAFVKYGDEGGRP